jgi:hypothetical protein
MAYYKEEIITDNPDLGEIRIGNLVIDTKSIKINRKIKLEKIPTTRSYDGAGWTLSEREVDWEASDIPMTYYEDCKRAYRDQTKSKESITVSTYNFDESGDMNEEDVLYHNKIESLEKNIESGNNTFSMKGQALKDKLTM